MKTFTLDCSIDENNKGISIEHSGYALRLYHDSKDAANVKRLSLSNENMRIELLPSKGLSITEAFCRAQSYFWHPPLTSLPDPDAFNPSDTIYLNGERTEGYGWIRQFTAGVEMLGLKNWGLPRENPESREIMPMHGTASLIPVKTVNVKLAEHYAEISGAFLFREGSGSEDVPWYSRGKIIFEVVKKIIIQNNGKKVIVKDRIINRSTEKHKADWGYHVQLRPAEGAEYFVPSRKMRNSEKTSASYNHEIWHPSREPGIREQTMNIHKNLLIKEGALGKENGIDTLLKYPDGHAILAVIPPAPWIGTWISAGGKGGKEWCYGTADKGHPVSIMENDYDGIGPEFGQSDLFHHDEEEDRFRNADLEPGQRIDIMMIFRMLTSKQARSYEREIREYSKNRDIGRIL